MCTGHFWILVSVLIGNLLTQRGCSGQPNGLSTWYGGWQVAPTTSTSWSLHTRIPMTSASRKSYSEEEVDDESGRGKGPLRGGKLKVKKKYRKFLLPLLIAYKLKFFALIPVLIGGLLLLTGATGLAGFFFALFAATMGLKSGGH